MAVPISDWLCRYFGVSPQPLLDKCLQHWVKKDLAFNTGGNNEKSGIGNLGKKTEHHIGHGRLSFTVMRCRKPHKRSGLT